MIYFETDYVGEVYNLNHPRILWNSVTRRSTVFASSSAVGFAAENALTPTEYDTWKPTAMPATWALTFDATETINAVAISTHTFGTSGTTVAVQEFVGGVWVDIISATPADDEPIAFLYSARDRASVRISLTGAVAPEMGVVVACEAIEIPQKVYMGAQTPIDLALVTEFDSTVSTGGRYMGRSVKYDKNENDFMVSHLKEGYVRATLMPFIKDAREYPYFLLERPCDFPSALSYRWRDQDITPQRMGVRSYMQVTL